MEFINELSKEFYEKYAKNLIRLLAADESCKLQRIAFLMIQKSPSLIEYLDRKRIFTALIRSIILLIAHSNYEVKEVALGNFEKLLNTRDPMHADIMQV